MLRLVLFAIAVLAVPAAAQECRTNELGAVICRDLPDEPRPRPRPTIPLENWSDHGPGHFIPSIREDSFGRIRPDRSGRFESPGFRERSRPGPVQLPCRTDAFGNTICP